VTTLRKSRLLSRLQLPPISRAEKHAVARLLTWAPWGNAPVPEDARRFVEVLAHHRLLGVLEYCARSDQALADWLAHTGVLAELEPRWQREAARVTAIADELAHVQALARASGTVVFALKGAHLGRTCYPSPRARPMEDLDVLVAAADLPRLVAALFADGYRVVAGQERNGPSTRLHYDQLAHPARGVILEVHHQVAHGFGLAALAPVGDALPPHFHFLHRLLDIAKDGCVRTGLLPYLDLLQLGRSDGGVAAEQVWELAERVGVAEFAADANWHLERLCLELGLTPPLTRARQVRSPMRRLLRTLHGRSDGMWRIRYVPRWQRRLIGRVVGTVG
jgi:hypothetical protein